MAVKRNWYWDTPRPPQHSVVFQSPIGYDNNQVAVVPYVHLLNNGDLISNFSYSVSLSDAVQLHRTQPTFQSSDGGQTWTEQATDPPELVRQPIKVTTISQGGRQLARPSRLPDGSLIFVGNAGWENYPASRKKEFVKKGYYVFDESHGNKAGVISVWYRAFKVISKDGGKTWKQTEINLPVVHGSITAYHMEALTLDDGTFLKPVNGKIHQNDELSSSSVLRTTDNGETWNIHTIARGSPTYSGGGFSETGITQAHNGDVVTVMRTSNQRELWTAISSDGGKTWCEPRDSGLRGSTPWLITLADGRLLATFGRRSYKTFPKTGIWYGISDDHGRTWRQHMVVDRGAELVAAQGMVVALPDGSAFVVYSYLNSKTIGGTRFHPRFVD